MQILKYEIKKILARKSAVISILILGIFLVFKLSSVVSDTIYVDANGNEIKGFKAVKLTKADKVKWNGKLSIDAVKKVIATNHSIEVDSRYKGLKLSEDTISNMKYARKQGFSDLHDLINESFGKVHSYDYYLIDRLKTKDASRFYSNREKELKRFLGTSEVDWLSPNEKQYVIKSIDTLVTPLEYSYADGWKNSLENSSSIIYFLVLIIAILMAPVFSQEYQTGSDAIILSTEHGRKIGIKCKLLAGFIVTTALYIIVSLLSFGSILTIFGFDGAGANIQAFFSSWKSTYHINMLQAFMMVVFIGYVVCLFIAALAMFLSAKLKTAFATIILIFVVIMGPATIGEFLPSGIGGDRILNLMPHQMLDGWKLIRTYTFYNVFNKVLTPYQLLPLLYGGISLLLMPLAYRKFRKHQVA